MMPSRTIRRQHGSIGTPVKARQIFPLVSSRMFRFFSLYRRQTENVSPAGSSPSIRSANAEQSDFNWSSMESSVIELTATFPSGIDRELILALTSDAALTVCSSRVISKLLGFNFA